MMKWVPVFSVLVVLLLGSLTGNCQLAFHSPYPEIPQDTVKAVVTDEEIDTSAPVDDEYSDTETVHKDPVIDSVTFRAVPDSTTLRLKKDKDFAYANDAEYWVKEKEKEGRSVDFIQWLFTDPKVKGVMYVLLGAILAFAIYKVIVNNNLFYRASRKIETVTDEEVLGENIGDLEDKIRKAIANKEYRKAVRYLYVKTLRELDQKNLIRYHSQATNYDYLAQVSQYKFAGQFSFLTQVYDYAWYGGFELNETQFEKVLNDFTNFFNGLKAW